MCLYMCPTGIWQYHTYVRGPLSAYDDIYPGYTHALKTFADKISTESRFFKGGKGPQTHWRATGYMPTLCAQINPYICANMCTMHIEYTNIYFRRHLRIAAAAVTHTKNKYARMQICSHNSLNRLQHPYPYTYICTYVDTDSLILTQSLDG